MRLIFGAVLAFGLLLAGAAVYLMQSHLTRQQTQFAAQIQATGTAIPTAKVIIAARPLRYGELVRPQDVAIVDWPSTALPPGAMATLNALFPTPGADRFVVRAMERGEPVLAVKVTEPGQDAGIRSQLVRGMRAFAINVDVQTGVSGFLRPGDRVDVYWTGSAPATNGRRGPNITQLIDRSLPIIAVDQSADAQANGATIARTITVQVTPQQVAALAQAQTSGRLSLALVGADDDTLAMANEVDQRSLLGLQAPQIETRQPDRVCMVKTRRGAEVVDIPIPCTN
ncbi:MAG: Flp pilus assembly protein CpaB [Pseudomonadota bacterium]